jgi:hypothetical protein
MPAVKIETFIGDLPVRESALVRRLLQIVHDAMSEPETRGLMTSDVCLIREMAVVYDGESYRVFMQGIVAALDGGPAWLLAAYKTVRHALELLHHFPADVSALQKVNEVWMRLSQPEQNS